MYKQLVRLRNMQDDTYVIPYIHWCQWRWEISCCYPLENLCSIMDALRLPTWEVTRNRNPISGKLVTRQHGDGASMGTWLECNFIYACIGERQRSSHPIMRFNRPVIAKNSTGNVWMIFWKYMCMHIYTYIYVATCGWNTFDIILQQL